MLRAGLKTRYKTSVSDVVSAADHAAEELIVARLAEERPDDGLVGEEGSRSPGERTWVIDPVDGTYNFLSGVPYWCSAVGLSDAQGRVLGAVYYPAVDQLWLGGRNRPTEENQIPVAPLANRPLAEVSVSTYSHPAHMRDQARRTAWEAAVSSAATVRMFGSASIDLASVASGRIGAFLQADLKDWDWIPGAALVTAAGGRAEVVQVGDNHWHLAGNAQTVTEIEAALRGAHPS
jgi:fructose-1,6-bisphosphatase/inositol monophosphatase family enzyme